MATYVNDLRLKEIATGDEAGTWGTSTNTNLELIAEAFSFGTEAITTNADTHTTTIADGSTDPGRSIYLKYTGTLDSACTITIGPNTVSKLWFIENGTSGSQNIIISQGSGANITIPAGDVKAVYSDGAGSGAAIVDAFASLNVVDLKVEDDLTVTDDLIVNGDIDLAGSIDVDGTANLDVVDIDGALTQDGGAVFNEDSADVDFRVESNGEANMLFVNGGDNTVLIGSSTSIANTGGTGALQVLGTGGGDTTLTIGRFSANASPPTLAFTKSRNATIGSNTIIQDGDNLGQIIFCASDGNDMLSNAAKIEVEVDGTPGADDLPGRMGFYTTPDGGTGASERLRINANGTVGIGTAGGSYAIDLLTTGNNGLRVNTGTSSADQLYLGNTGGVASVGTLTSDDLGIITAGSERARVTTGGIVLVGKTSSGVSSVGAEIRTGSSNYSFTGTSSGHTVQLLNRTSDDGDVVEFRQDNTKFGSIASDGNDLILDVVGNIRLDADDGGEVRFLDGGTQFATVKKDGNNALFQSIVADGDFVIQGIDGSSFVTAITFDMSDAGTAIFGSWQKMADNNRIVFGAGSDMSLFSDGTNGNILTSGSTSLLVTHSASAHVSGINIINTQAGGYGSAVNFQSERSDNNVIATAGRIRTEGAEAWNADNAVSSALVFETVADNTLAERMRISSGGNLTLGGTTVGAAGALSVQPNFDDGAAVITFNRSSTTNTSDVIRFKNGGSTVSQISHNNSTVTYGTSSDARLKNILGEAKGLEIVNKLNPVNFEWKDGGEIQDGLIAQEVEELIPYAINVNEEGYYSMDYSKLVTPLIKAIQEQQEQIDALQSEINILKGE